VAAVREEEEDEGEEEGKGEGGGGGEEEEEENVERIEGRDMFACGEVSQGERGRREKVEGRSERGEERVLKVEEWERTVHIYL